MRIVFISWRDLAHPQAGGSEVVVDNLARGLRLRGHEVVLLSGGPVAARPYEVIATGGTYSQYLRAPLKYWRHARPADVVVDVENGIPFFAPVWQRAPVVCLVYHVHTEQWAMRFAGPVARFGRWLERSVMPRVYRSAYFVAISESTRRELVGLGVDGHRMRTIEMGWDQEPVSMPRSPEPRFLVLGRLVPHKRVDLALRIWEQVRPLTGGQLVVVGDGPERDQLRDQAGPGVEFTGRVTAEEKRRQLGAAWLLIHPAHHEGWGIVVIEAAGAGLPTVAFDVPGVRDSIADGISGILAADERAFADAWVRLANDADARLRLGKAARQRAAGFTWERAVAAFDIAVREAAQGPRSGGHGDLT